MQQLPVDSTYIAHEEQIVKQWDESNLYGKIMQKNKDKPQFDFIDGPPFVSGNLHPGHIAVGSFKSAVFNYKNMTGFNCSVKLGYDCHGLPALNKTASDNNLTIEQFKALDIADSNRLCEEMIFKYKGLWKPLIQRIGRLADFNNDYMTRDKNFMESCWWIFKQIYEQGNVYSGEKVMPYSYGNQTPLSNFEASQNFLEKETKSIYVSFELIHPSDDILEKEYIVVWTTTPWTLPSNLALCVNAESDYVKVRLDSNKKIYIVAKNCISNLFDKNTKFSVLHEFKGSELVGKEYHPMYPYTKLIDEEAKIDRKYKIVSDTFVDTNGVGSGTGVVHLAPAFGDDDFRVCCANNLITNTNVALYCPIDEYGRFTSVINEYKGKLCFDAEDDIRSELKKRGVLLKTQLYKHNYPYCWRTNTPLIYRTNPSIYIRATAYRERMLELNQTVRWFPQDIGKYRFNNWLSDIKDWSVSRSTSYATPIPIWKSADGDEICIGSIKELHELTGVLVDNLHPEYVNDLVIVKDGKTYHRVKDTFDCWFESGSVPFAQKHYPFEKDFDRMDQQYLTDFICEGLDQTRGWFYTLMVLSTAILDKAPYANVVCTGMILDKDGRKFSKKLNNFVDPTESINEFGADVMRVYFIASPVMNADSLKFNDEDIKKLKRRLIPYINGVKFWLEHSLTYNKNGYNLDFNLNLDSDRKLTNFMDKWILQRINQLISYVKQAMDEYRYGGAIYALLDFIEDLTNWYIKFNRDRIKGKESEQDQADSIYVLYDVLMKYILLWAPFTPFLSEHLFQHLKHCSKYRSVESVLLADYPEPQDLDKNHEISAKIIKTFEDIQRVCFITRALRDNTEYHTKSVIPIKKCTIYHDDPRYLDSLKENIHLVQSELNCLEFSFELLKDNASIKIEADKKMIGQFFRKDSTAVIKLIESQTSDDLQHIFYGEKKIVFEKDGDSFLIDDIYYKLIRVPNEVSGSNIKCKIDGDLMVSIDCTYDKTIHDMYQIKRLKSAVQNIRKKMGLHPWNSITVLLDTKYSTHELKNAVQSLLNTDVTVCDFTKENSDFNKRSNFNELNADENSCIIHSEEFTVEGYQSPNITGNLVVYVFK